MVDSQTEQSTVLIPMSVAQLLRILGTGAVVGAIMWGLTLLLDAYVFRGIVCKGMESMQCSASLQYANISASILAAGVGLFILARLQVFRALLVVVAAAVSLWGMAAMLHSLGWQIVLPALALSSLLAYGLFAWIARLRSFLLALVIIVVLVVIMRLILNL